MEMFLTTNFWLCINLAFCCGMFGATKWIDDTDERVAARWASVVAFLILTLIIMAIKGAMI